MGPWAGLKALHDAAQLAASFEQRGLPTEISQ